MVVPIMFGQKRKIFSSGAPEAVLLGSWMAPLLLPLSFLESSSFALGDLEGVSLAAAKAVCRRVCRTDIMIDNDMAKRLPVGSYGRGLSINDMLLLLRSNDDAWLLRETARMSWQNVGQARAEWVSNAREAYEDRDRLINCEAEATNSSDNEASTKMNYTAAAHEVFEITNKQTNKQACKRGFASRRTRKIRAINLPTELFP